MSNMADFTTTLHLAPQQVEALKAIGRERGTCTDWLGHYVAMPDLREMGLAINVLGFWRLTVTGRQVYAQLFGSQAA